jgi:TetR/AcrR family transcriptional regulator
MATTAPDTKIRDAERSRALILAAAEQLFARRGYDAASLAEIGEEAGVSRGTPSYFFGSKEELYVAVLERMYADRNAALGPAFAQLTDWAEQRNPSRSLKAVLTRAVAAYVDFLHGRPSYVDIMEREALAGGERLRKLQTQSTVMEDAFAALRRRARAHGLKNFDVPEAITVLVGLGYLPVAHRSTMLRRHGLRVEDAAFTARRKKHIVDMLLHLLGASS